MESKCTTSKKPHWDDEKECYILVKYTLQF
jgi:hypothetical protein